MSSKLYASFFGLENNLPSFLPIAADPTFGRAAERNERKKERKKVRKWGVDTSSKTMPRSAMRRRGALPRIKGGGLFSSELKRATKCLHSKDYNILTFNIFLSNTELLTRICSGDECVGCRCVKEPEPSSERHERGERGTRRDATRQHCQRKHKSLRSTIKEGGRDGSGGRGEREGDGESGVHGSPVPH